MTSRMQLVRIGYHLLLPLLARGTTRLDRRRALLDRLGQSRRPADGRLETLRLAGVPCSAFKTGQPSPSAVIFYLHGGGHVLGSPRSHAGLLWRIARSSGLELVASDHRLAPEAPFPASYQDALAAYRALCASGRGQGRIILMGDSAGGNLVFALLHTLCRQGCPPLAAIALSPWTDLGSVERPAARHGRRERRYVGAIMQRLIQAYAPDLDRGHPLISPVHGDYPGAPPVLIQAGSGEPLLDDAERIARRLRHFGVPVTLQTWPGAIHVFQALAAFLPEAREAIEAIGDFIRRLPGPGD